MDPPVGSKRRSPSPHSDELDNEPLIPLMGGRRDSPSPERSAASKTFLSFTKSPSFWCNFVQT